MSYTPTRNFRLDDRVMQALERLAVRWGTTKTGAIRFAVLDAEDKVLGGPPKKSRKNPKKSA